MFKVGDRVRMLRIPSGCIGIFERELIGSIVTITEINSDGVLIIDKNKWECNVYPSDVELINDNPNKQKEVINMDLKEGVKVRLKGTKTSKASTWEEVKNEFGAYKGQVVTLGGSIDGNFYIKEFYDTKSYSPIFRVDDLELVTDNQTSKFKEGDRVRCVDNPSTIGGRGCGWSKGREFVIDNIWIDKISRRGGNIYGGAGDGNGCYGEDIELVNNKTNEVKKMNIEIKDMKPANVKIAKKQCEEEAKNAEISEAKRQYSVAVDERDNLDRQIKALQENQKVQQKILDEFKA